MRKFFLQRNLKILYFSIIIVIAVSISAQRIFAVWSGTYYNPGDTLNPECLPTDAECDVLIFPSQTGNSGKYLTTNGTTTSWATVSGGLANVVEDTTPQLGGNLDLNGNTITGMVIGTDIQAYNSKLANFVSSNLAIATNTISASSGDITLSPASGSNLNISLATTGDFAVNTDDLYVDTSSGFIGIGTTGPDRRLDVLDASNPQLRLTYTDGSVYTDFTTDGSGNLTIGTTGSSVSTSGSLYAGIDMRVPGTRYFYWENRSLLKSPADGNLQISNYAENDFGLLQFGGQTSAFPALKRSSTELQVRLADDSGWGKLQTGTQYINITTATDIGLVIKGAVSQTGNLTEWRDSSNTLMSYIASNGNIFSSIEGQNALRINSTSTYYNNSVAIGTLSSLAVVTNVSSVAVGASATAGSEGTAIGGGAGSTHARSVSIGNSSKGGTDGVAVGTSAGTIFYTGATHIGYIAQAGNYGIAIGYRSSAGNYQFVAGSGHHTGITDVFFGTGIIRDGQAGAGASYTIHGSGAYGTDYAGGNITIAGGKGTGAGTGGRIIFSTADALVSGTTLQSLTEKISITTSGLLTFQGITASEVALKRNGTELQVRLADDSGYAPLQAAAGTFNGNLTVDTNTLFVDATNNRVGIGTTSPSTTLHVISTAAQVATFSSTASGNMEVKFNAATNYNTNMTFQEGGVDKWYFGSQAADDRFYLANSGDTKRFIMKQTDGYIGMGMTSSSLPSAQLHVRGDYASNYGQVVLQSITGTGNQAIVYESYYDSAGTRLMVMGLGHYASATDPNYYFANEISNGGVVFRNASSNTFEVTSAGNVIIPGNLTVDTNTLFVDATNNRVGIGTTSPNASLDVSSGRITQGGAASNYNLNLYGSTYAYFGLNTSGTGKTSARGFQFGLEDTGSYAGANLILRENQNMRFWTNNTIKATLTAGGLLAIGAGITSSYPALKRSSTELQVRLADDSGFAPLQAAAGTFNGNLTVDTNTLFVDATNNRVGIGDTNPSSPLMVVGEGLFTSSSANVGPAASYTGSSGRKYSMLSCYNCGTAGLGGFEIYDDTASATRAYIQAGVNGWQTPSDERLKTNIENLTVLDKIRNIRGVSYTLIESGIPQIGVIAQEVKEVFPLAVSGSEEEGRYLGVNYNSLAAIAIQGIKELDIKLIDIETLEQETTFIARLREWLGDTANGIAQIYAQVIKSERVETQELCIDDLCITKDQLQQLLNNQGINTTNIGGSEDDTSDNDNTDTGNTEDNSSEGDSGGDSDGAPDSNGDISSSSDGGNEASSESGENDSGSSDSDGSEAL